jgi:hypothetical protein
MNETKLSAALQWQAIVVRTLDETIPQLVKLTLIRLATAVVNSCYDVRSIPSKLHC